MRQTSLGPEKWPIVSMQETRAKSRSVRDYINGREDGIPEGIEDAVFEDRG